MNQYFPQSRPHPGETLEEKLLEMGVSPQDFALQIGEPESTIVDILNGLGSITPDLAIKFEEATIIPARFWIAHQLGYDEFYSGRT